MKDQDLNPCLHTFMEIIKSAERKQSNHCVFAHQAATRNRQPPTDDNINFSHGQQCCFPPPHKQKYTHIHSQKCKPEESCPPTSQSDALIFSYPQSLANQKCKQPGLWCASFKEHIYLCCQWWVVMLLLMKYVFKGSFLAFKSARAGWWTTEDLILQ